MKKKAFTLAEVLITLGIIGVVAAMTLPAIINKSEQMILKNQFKKSYANFFNAVKLAQTNLGGNVACFYWENGGLCPSKCTGTNSFGDCIIWSCIDDSPLPPDIDGPRNDCTAFENELVFKTLKTVKFCQNNSLANGCITKEYKGTDEIKKAQNPDPSYTPDPNGAWSKNRIQNNNSSFILADGTMIMYYNKIDSKTPIYAIDVNGHKKPNMWGKDIFLLQLFGNTSNGITQLNAATYSSYPLVEGAVSTGTMIQNMYK